MTKFSKENNKKINPGDFHKNPFFYFGMLSFVLLGALFLGSSSLAQLDTSGLIVFNQASVGASPDNGDLYFNQNSARGLETPELKTSEDNFVYGVTTPRVVSAQILGAIMGGLDQSQGRREVIDYIVQPGDTIDSIAGFYGLPWQTIAWANNLSGNSTLKTGQTIAIFPFAGVSYVVKSGDTLEKIIKDHSDKNHQPSIDQVVADNNLANQQDLSIGFVLLIRDGIMQQVLVPSFLVRLPKSSLLLPLLRALVTQPLHYYNAVDLASKCGDYVYAAAAGTVERAVFNNGWNLGMGNYVTVLHTNGVVTYYGHLQYVSVAPGSSVYAGQILGLEGRTGNATGCHVHFEVIGAENPFGQYRPGTTIDVNSF